MQTSLISLLQTYHATYKIHEAKSLVEGEGFEPSKAEPSDLQSDPFNHSGIPPNELAIIHVLTHLVKGVCTAAQKTGLFLPIERGLRVCMQPLAVGQRCGNLP